MSPHLQDAKGLISLAEGREGPEDAQHATQLVIANALISIAASLEILAEQAEIDAARADLEFTTRLYSQE